MDKNGQISPQIIRRNDLDQATHQAGLQWWSEEYFRLAVTTAESSRKVQRRDLDLFLQYLIREEQSDRPASWTPRLSRDFLQHLRSTIDQNGTRRWSDKTVIRILAHLKTFAKWVHKHYPFPLGQPMENSNCLRSVRAWRSSELSLPPSAARFWMLPICS